MKTIVHNGTKLSKYLFADDVDLDIRADGIRVGEATNPDFWIADLNSTNSTLVLDVPELKSEWRGNKFFYDGGWKENPDWVDPEELAELEAAGRF